MDIRGTGFLFGYCSSGNRKWVSIFYFVYSGMTLYLADVIKKKKVILFRQLFASPFAVQDIGDYSSYRWR